LELKSHLLLIKFENSFQGPQIAVLDSNLAKDPKAELTRALKFLGQNTTGIECALSRMPPFKESANFTIDQFGEEKVKWTMVMDTLKESGIQIQ
jgi:hypothetical protein